MSERIRRFLSRWLLSPLAGVALGDWLAILRENRFQVSPAYWPRAAFTTLMAPINSLEARRERRRHGAHLERVEVARPVFVLGHYRSGTTHLHNLLCVDERFTYTNNLRATYPRSFLTTEATKRRLGAVLTVQRRPQDDVRLDLEVPGEDELALCADCRLSTHMVWHFPRRAEAYERFLTLREASDQEREAWKASLVRFCRKLTLLSGGRTIVLKSPCHTAKVPLILEAFPDARFVHIHRDPYTIYASTLKMERTVPPLFAYQRRDPDSIPELVLRRYRQMYDAYLSDRERVPQGQLHELAFAQLEEDPVRALSAVYRALDLPTFETVRPALEAYVDAVRSYRKNRYPQPAPELRARIAERWAPCFQAWGYPT